MKDDRTQTEIRAHKAKKASGSLAFYRCFQIPQPPSFFADLGDGI